MVQIFQVFSRKVNSQYRSLFSSLSICKKLSVTVFSVNGHLLNIFIIMKHIIVTIDYSFYSYFWEASLIFLNMYLFLAVLGLHCFMGFSLVLANETSLSSGTHASHAGVSPVAEHRLQGVQAFVVVARGLSRCSSQALEHRLSNCGAQAYFPTTCGILPGQGSNPCLLRGRWILHD